MAAEFPHFSAFRPVTAVAAVAQGTVESSASTAMETSAETGCAEVSTTVDKVENEETPVAVAEDCGERGKRPARLTTPSPLQPDLRETLQVPMGCVRR